MHRIDHSTAQDGRFVGGNPASGIPATTVTPDIMNSIQEEIIGVIESRGITLEKTQNNQLLLAIQDILKKKDQSFVVANNQSAVLMGAPFEFDLASVAGATIRYCAIRKDSTQEKTEIGKLFIFALPNQAKFILLHETRSNDEGTGMTFDISMAGNIGKVIYSSTNFLGSNYEGKIVYDITTFKK